MINRDEAKIHKPVFYQQKHMRVPEYGIIVGIPHDETILQILFVGDTTPKPCHIGDLFWPANFFTESSND